MPSTPRHVLVLTAAAGALAADLPAGLLSALAGGLADEGIWLAMGEAWEAELEASIGEEASRRDLLADVRRRLEGLPVDINIVAGDPALRRKRLLVSDMDSTIIQQECIDEMADMLGIKPAISAITERAMRGELDFEAALAERLSLLAGMRESELQRVLETRISLMPGARTLTATMRAHGATTVLVSGGFTFFTSRIAALAGFETNHANTLEVADGRLTGRAVPPILGRDAKRAALEEHARRLGLDLGQTLAVGDGANDLAMIEVAGLGVAYRAKPVVAAEAAASIVHADLRGLLYLQGYTSDDLVEPGA